MRFTQKLCLLFIFLFLMIAGYRALAVPIIGFPQGEFVLQDDFEPVMKISVEKVVAINKEGQARLQDLQKTGYACRSVGRSIFRCVHQTEIEHVYEDDLKKIRQTVTAKKFNFSELDGQADLIHDGEVYKVWRVYKTVRSGENLWKFYDYSWTPTVEKVQLGEVEEKNTQYLVVETEQVFSQQVRVTRTLSKNQFEIRIFNAFFKMR